MQDINRLKLVLVEKKRTNKWLSEQLGINPSTVSKEEFYKLKYCSTVVYMVSRA